MHSAETPQPEHVIFFRIVFSRRPKSKGNTVIKSESYIVMASRRFNELPLWIFVFLWLGANIATFIASFFVYFSGRQYIYLNRITGPYAVPFARASGACLNLNSALILLPVCRNLISFLRGSVGVKVCKRSVTRLFDKNITFHKACAYMIVFWTIIHYYAHTFNVEFYLQALDKQGVDNQTRRFLMTLSQVGRNNNTWLNFIESTNTNPMLELIKVIAGWTGVVLTLALVLMVSSATEVIRRSYFEVFWFTHHLFIIYYIMLVIHGVGKLVRRQANLDAHDPDVCQDRFERWGSDEDCPLPVFDHQGASSYQWVVGSVFLYFVERCIRFWRSQQKVTIVKVVKHPSKVLELQLQKKGFHMESGQYIFLHCPSISCLEWHPFTLTSAPNDDYFSVHIRLGGDWTTALSKACLCDEKDLQNSADLPGVAVDGPFGTASEDIYRYRSVVLVGAGIGVTPFASILKDIWYKFCDPEFQMKTTKVYFYWICPDTNAFEWFSDLLKHLEDQMKDRGQADFLSYNIYLTRGWNTKQALNITTHEEDTYDVITGLKAKTFYGRPNWDQEFSKIAGVHTGTRVGVFFCGPKVLSSELHKNSNKHSDANTNTFFVYNKENF